MTFPFSVLLNWVPSPIWLSKKGNIYLSIFHWEKLCWYGLCIRMNQCLQQTPLFYPFILQDLFLFLWYFELTLVLGENLTSALGDSVATWSVQVYRCFCGVPYIILISASSTVPALFIPLSSPHINLITLQSLKDNITALMIIILNETWHDCQILPVAVDISWNTRRGFC